MICVKTVRTTFSGSQKTHIAYKLLQGNIQVFTNYVHIVHICTYVHISFAVLGLSLTNIDKKVNLIV